MNNGAFGENFPYANFHDLNMDWIIKIAKDFLDQYTHIQEVIATGEQSLQELTEDGLTQLQESATALESALNEWYTTHQNYLDQTLLDNKNELNSYASQKLADVLESIPADYSDLSNVVARLNDRSFKDALILAGLILENKLDITKVSLTQGVYNASYEWGMSNNIYTTRYAMRVPDNCTISGHVTNTNLSIYIMEFDPNTNTRIRNISSSTYAIMNDTNKDYVYTISVQKGTGVPVPVDDYDVTLQYIGNDYICTKDETNILAEIIANGYATRNDELTVGFFDPDGIWKQEASNRHYSVRKMYRFPKNTFIEISGNYSEGQLYLKGFSKSGNRFTRVLNLGGSQHIAYTTTRDDLYYNIDLYNNNGWSNPPSGGYQMRITLPNYAQANEQDTMFYSYNATNEELVIQTKKTKYTIKHIVNDNINLNSWRFFEGLVYINGDYREIWNNSDAEGPILIDNEADFISGYHGDEQYTEIKIFIDTQQLQLNTNSEGYCHSITMYQTSNVYRANTNTKAFDRYKRIRIKGNDFNVQQRWVSAVNCTITRGALCVLQAPKTYMLGWDTDLLIPMRNQNTGDTLNSRTRLGTFYLQDNTMISLIPEVGCDNEYFTPSVANFSEQNRLKFYFDMYNGKTLSVGDSIESKFSVKINELK